MAGTWDNESLWVLFSPFCLLSTILLQCLVMMLLPQPNNSEDKENFKNRLCWSHDIILRVQRLLTLLKCKLLSHLHQSIQIIKLLITHLWFLWHDGEKIVENALSFCCHFKTGEACALSSHGVSRKCYITTVTGNSRLQLVRWSLMQ